MRLIGTRIEGGEEIAQARLPLFPSTPRLVSRRSAMVGAAAAMAGASTGSASAQVVDPRPPTVDVSDPKQVADGVWILRDHRIWLVPNIGIIVGRDAALVIDTGLGPANGERVLNVARQIAGRRRLILTTTHFHPEHTTGAQVFRPDVAFLCNAAQRDEIAQKGTRYVDLFRRTQSAATSAALVGTTVVIPNATYHGSRAEIDLGGRTVELHTVGTAHTGSDQIAFLPRERILFAGDLIEERMFPIFPWFPPEDTDVDGANWVAVLNGFRRYDPTLIVPGHGDAGGISIATALASQIDVVRRKVQALSASGKSTAEIIRDDKPDLVAVTPTWQHPGLLDWQIAYFVAHPARGLE